MARVLTIDSYTLKFNYLLCRNTVFKFLLVLKTLAYTLFHLLMRQNCLPWTLKWLGVLPVCVANRRMIKSLCKSQFYTDTGPKGLKPESYSLLSNKNQVCMKCRESALLNSNIQCLELSRLCNQCIERLVTLPFLKSFIDLEGKFDDVIYLWEVK